MKTLFAAGALLPEGWVDNVRIGIDASGHIAEIEQDAKARAGDTDLGDRVLLPAIANLHSHAFQRAMAGMCEHRSPHGDDFWSWRALMYRFLDVLTPDHVEAIAAFVYIDMLEAGYASVGEFHYLHHRPGGKAYDNPSETSERIFAAVEVTGIGLAHLPVLYSHGGAGKKPLEGGQLRFGCDPDRFDALVDKAARALSGLSKDCSLGVAPHSLRACDPEALGEIAMRYRSGPVHIHIAEQEREVADIEAWLGARPVAWLLDNVDVDSHWCLIHATHMSDEETTGLARSGAVAGLCPITEANLGDGTFNARSYMAQGGRFGIGSDSNIRISLSEELRQLEYSQRLACQARNVLADPGASTGETLYRRVARGGAGALARNSGALEKGRLADMIAIDATHPALCGLDRRQLLDGWVFAGDDRLVTDVWSAGRHCVEGGRHVRREDVERRFRGVMAELKNRI
ncbi:formimidoylglutamate deiminase [Hoeflea prorocentri]|uniref:Formimidoylglutamate deiminase n=1 Tax=Hoeflea prorocentri TaxID=1922333 RepID=A0A9X3UK13_9HYPH|nr:formimidoylglutamate deiminase [Hoeflea prorocentri]MCY6382001.1 formimidoylglutamate deiminase [Hoeflea prorocentri]MDA5399801.1 formimidoylglutamate deiminase [Hoeflea prorocentri]